ncbi:hypothetical protein HDU97_008407 [Phlyctochytrium planicorne]|nr:hypothetical protein HDU97_008407 [Phlyctochytrium planicorne]
MLKTTALIAILAASATIPSVKAGFWTHIFQTCLSKRSSQILSQVVYATLPSEPVLCTPLDGYQSYVYVAKDDNTIVKAPCNDQNTNSATKESPKPVTKFTGRVTDCLTDYVFYPIPSFNGSKFTITTNHMLNNLPPVDWMVAATAVVVKHKLLSIPQGNCVSRSLSYSYLIPVWESCANLPHKQGSLFSNFVGESIDNGQFFHNQLFPSPGCKGDTLNDDRFLYPPASGGACSDYKSSVGPKDLAEATFPGWPLEKTSKYPTDKPSSTLEGTELSVLMPADFDGDHVLFPFDHKDDPRTLPTRTTDPFDLPTRPTNVKRFDPAVPVKPALLFDGSFDAYPTRVMTGGANTATPGIGGGGSAGGNGKNGGVGRKVGVVGLLLGLGLAVLGV